MRFLQMYGGLTNLFRQKKGERIPYLDSKFQETVFARVFQAMNVDIGNTPHDILSELDGQRIGVGLKTWMNSKPSFQKVMQIKSSREDINPYFKNNDDLVYMISEIKNIKLRRDYNRLGLSEDQNIYHYITRDQNEFCVNECSYPLVQLDNLTDIERNSSSIIWSDGLKRYKYTFADSQIWQHFNSNQSETLLDSFKVEIMEDPFSFLLDSYKNFKNSAKNTNEIIECYLPLYSYRSGEVEEKSGLNAWNAAPKVKGSDRPRPLNEVYIPIPRDFHTKCPDFFVHNIFEFEQRQKEYRGEKKNKPEVRFHLNLPNGQRIPSLVTQSNMKGLQSGSQIERDENGNLYGQSALGQWLLVDVLGLKDRTQVTREWLRKRGTDSVRLWRNKGSYNEINIDFAPFGSFERFMEDEPNE